MKNDADNFKFIEEPLKERLKKNSIANILFFILSLPIFFFLTPLILKYVGKEVYGIWVLTGTILTFIELFTNMQMSSAVFMLIPKYDIRKEEKDINEICNTLVIFYLFVSIVVAILYFIFRENFINVFFKVNRNNIEVVNFVLSVSVCFFLINFVMTGFVYILGGFNIFYINSIFHIIIGYIRAGLIIVILVAGYGIKGIVIVQMTTILFETIILAFFTKVFYPPLKIGFKYFNFNKLKIMFNIGIKLLFSKIAVQVNNNIDKLILGYFLNPVIITYYQLGAGIAKYISNVPEMLGLYSLLPAASELKSKNQNEKIVILYNRINKYIFFIAFLLCSGFIIFGREFINLWLGSDYNDAYVALAILSIAYTLGIAGFAALNLLNGMEKINETMIVSVICAIVNIILSIVLTKYYGLKGAAAGTLVSMGAGAIMYYFLFYKIVKSHLNIIDVFLKPLICVVVGAGFNYLVEIKISVPSNWILFFGKAVIYTIVYFFTSYFIVKQFDNYDKEIIKSYIPFFKSTK
jgi:O-antigen/teichoic acid export membrane protein